MKKNLWKEVNKIKILIVLISVLLLLGINGCDMSTRDDVVSSSEDENDEETNVEDIAEELGQINEDLGNLDLD